MNGGFLSQMGLYEFLKLVGITFVRCRTIVGLKLYLFSISSFRRVVPHQGSLDGYLGVVLGDLCAIHEPFAWRMVAVDGLLVTLQGKRRRWRRIQQQSVHVPVFINIGFVLFKSSKVQLSSHAVHTRNACLVSLMVGGQTTHGTCMTRRVSATGPSAQAVRVKAMTALAQSYIILLSNTNIALTNGAHAVAGHNK